MGRLDSLNERQIKFLTYLVYILLTFSTLVSGWCAYRIIDMPEKYVMKERYLCDQDRLEKTLDKIDTKLDRLIER
jgi:hypothetical protein